MSEPPAPLVLVVDDDPAVLELVREMLTEGGYRTAGAGSGEAAVEAARARAPDLIVCDRAMPGLDGHGVLAAVRADPSTADTPFVFLTGMADEEDLRHGMEAGAEDYLRKPVTSERLLRAVGTQLAKREAARQRAEQELGELRRMIGRAVPHELLTPLTVILGYATLLRSAENLSGDSLRDAAERILGAAERLERTVRNVLLHTELELLAGDPLLRERVSSALTPLAAGVVREAVEAVAARWDRRSDLTLELRRGSAGIPPSHLRAVAEHLSDNAFKFSERDSPVTVRLSFEGEEMRLEVADRGRGLTPDELRRAGAFVQFGRERFEQQGSGLGLAIARRAVTLAGGRLEIESGAAGTTVQVVLRGTPSSG